uniref:Leucine rich repeat containing protein n=1 Tax=Clytia hemisphaerica TaxID=252671 RepID=A0A7M5VA07_9CNID
WVLANMEETSAVEKSESKANLGEDYWLQELCLSNGLDPKSDLSQVELLELFLSVIPMVPSLNTYPSLTILRIVGCTITKIENLHIVPNLKELWLCEGKIQKLEGLEKNSKLEKLYMYKNELSKIENISHLLTLTTLWLNKNKIEVIENMEQLRQLKFLNLSDNQIHSIGTSLICCNLLEEVNLSGNRINSLKDITNISCLRNLIALDLKDPMCHPNPVTLLCNYSTYVLYHMPSLKRLDSVDVSMKMLKEAAESTVNKKRIFYKMRIRTIQRECIEMREQLKEHLENLREESVTSIHKLSNATKELERELDELSTKPESKL